MAADGYPLCHWLWMLPSCQKEQAALQIYVQINCKHNSAIGHVLVNVSV